MGTKAVAKVTLVVNSGPKKNEQVHQSAKNSESCDDEFFEYDPFDRHGFVRRCIRCKWYRVTYLRHRLSFPVLPSILTVGVETVLLWQHYCFM